MNNLAHSCCAPMRAGHPSLAATNLVVSAATSIAHRHGSFGSQPAYRGPPMQVRSTTYSGRNTAECPV
jgi:hypothetical protein